MPGSILNADTGFPTFAEGEDSNAKIDKVMNYLYMLLEQLRYSLANLDADNFNDAGLKEIADGIARPLQTSFENEFGKTNALIEGWSNEYGSQIKLLTEWVGTDEDGNLLASAAEIKGTADANHASIEALAKKVDADSKALAGFKTEVSNTYATTQQFSNFQNSMNSTYAGFVSEANATYAKTAQIASVTDGAGNVTSASIVAKIKGDASLIELIADKVDISGFVTFESLANDGDGSAYINGNNLGLVSDSKGESISKISFYHDEMYGKSNYEIGTIYQTDDGHYGYSLCISANRFLQSSSKYADAFLLLRGEGGVVVTSVEDDIVLSSGSGISMYGQTYCDIGAANYGVRIHADSDYGNTIDSDPGENTFIFVNGGIYYIDSYGDPHVVWEL